MRSLTRSGPRHFTPFRTAAEEIWRLGRVAASSPDASSTENVLLGRRPKRIIGELSLARRSSAVDDLHVRKVKSSPRREVQ